MNEHDAVASESRNEPFSYTGVTSEYFRIWIVSLCLTVLTLGIYSAWAKVRKRRYLYRSTHLADGSFDYHADPVVILKGRLIAVAALLCYVAAGYFAPGVDALIMLVIVVTAWRLAGPRIAIFTSAALAYLAFLGLWEVSMATVALLGAVAFLCLLFGIPLGIWFGKSERAHAVALPVLDFMQTMPAFVYLIPIIAFFGTGKPPGVLATIIFGMPPVIRLTALGMRMVPETTKEAARAFGCTRAMLLRSYTS